MRACMGRPDPTLLRAAPFRVRAHRAVLFGWGLAIALAAGGPRRQSGGEHANGSVVRGRTMTYRVFPCSR